MSFQLLLFSTNTSIIPSAIAAGVDGIIVDWEYRGKARRQWFADTQINHDTPDDLERVRASTEARIICRINGNGDTTPLEIEQAIERGADEILVPMARQCEEVEAILECVRGRCGVGILIETVDALQHADEFAQLPLTRVYVGLNDLAIERRTHNIFTPLVDGTLETLRPLFKLPFGFGGLTLPECGFPIPCRLLIGEMARLDCQFSFLRRSFHRDMVGRDFAIEVPRLRAALATARVRSPEQIACERVELVHAIRNWTPGLYVPASNYERLAE